MPLLSNALDRISPSQSIVISNKAREMKAAGLDVISLSAGEPDFDTPDHIKQAAIDAINAGDTKYTNVDGTPALKKAVQAKFKRDNGLDYDLDQIIVNSGGKQTIYICMMATLNVGDEVIIPAPYWVSYPDIVELSGAAPVIITAGIEQDYKITPDQLRNAITDKTKWLIFNNPSNPTGAVYTREELIELGKVLAHNPHVWVLSDDIYEHIVFSGCNFTSFATACPDIANRVITMNGVAKAYAMTGWRIGYAAGDKRIIGAMKKLQGQSTTCSSSVSQAASAAALSGPQNFIQDNAADYEEKRDMVFDAIENIDGLTCPKPDGAFYLYVNIKALIGKSTPDGNTIKTDEDFVTYLLEDHLVAAVHGAAYGLSPYFRISYATSKAELQSGIMRLKQACEALV